MHQSTCPGRGRLLLYAQGKLPEELAEPIRAHLQHCRRCEVSVSLRPVETARWGMTGEEEAVVWRRVRDGVLVIAALAAAAACFTFMSKKYDGPPPTIAGARAFASDVRRETAAVSAAEKKPAAETPAVAPFPKKPAAATPTAQDAGNQQQAAAAKLELPAQISNPIGMKFRLIPAGEFQQGSPADDISAYVDEFPQHTVKITRPFYLGTTEVTQEQWKEVMGFNPSLSRKNDDHPVENITWTEAEEFCRKLSKLEKAEYRLPTEAEWEYACRAGGRTPTRLLSDDELHKVAWANEKIENFEADLDFLAPTAEDYVVAPPPKRTKVQPHPVAKKEPNAWGLYDMLGNVAEWCSDWYAPYEDAAATDPQGGVGPARYRVVRGGALTEASIALRPTRRAGQAPSGNNSFVGFRVVKVIPKNN